MDRLRSMETFVRIANSGSLTRAAEQLGTSRALVSKHLQKIEEHLQVRLFNRTTRQVALTDIGQEYLTFCQRILSEIDEEERSLAMLQSQPRGRLKLHSPMGYGNMHLAPVVSAFMEAYPDIMVNVVLSDTTMTPMEMIEGSFDLAIQTGEMIDMNFPSRKIGDVRWIVCATAKYLHDHGHPGDPNDLAEHNCLIHRKVSPDGIWAFGSDGQQRVKVTGNMLTNSVLIIRETVRKGQGIAMLPSYCIAADLAAGRLIDVFPYHPVKRRPVYILFAYNRYMPSRVRVFVDFLVARSQNIGAISIE